MVRRPILTLSVIAVALTLGATWGVAAVLDYPTLGIDDANITMVYGRNLAEGHGLVFTPGFERVEGFTSLAWTLITGAAYLLTPGPEMALLVASVLLCAVCVGSLLGTAVLLGRDGSGGVGKISLAFAAAAAVWVMGLPTFFAWNTVTLMDLVLWSALLHATTFVLVWDVSGGGRDGRGPLIVAGLGALLVVCRPEAIAVAPGLLALGVIGTITPQRSWRAALRRFAPALGIVAGTLVGVTLFRIAYFGYPLPNTYYAKVSPDRLYNAIEGVRYVASFLNGSVLRWTCLLAALALGVRGVVRPAERSVPERLGFIVAAVAVGGMALPLVGGGDHFEAHRFLQPFSPLLVLPALAAARLLVARVPAGVALRHRAPALGATAIVGAAWIYGGWWDFTVDRPLRREFTITERGRDLGAALNDAFPRDPRPTVGGIVAGGLGLTYRGRMVDLLGLNWTAMGHSPGDRKGEKNHSAFNEAVFWSDPPDIVTPMATINPADNGEGMAIDLYRELLGDVYHTARFRDHYQPGYVRTDSLAVSGFFARTWLDRSGREGFVALAWGSGERGEGSR